MASRLVKHLMVVAKYSEYHLPLGFGPAIEHPSWVCLQWKKQSFIVVEDQLVTLKSREEEGVFTLEMMLIWTVLACLLALFAP